MDAHELQVLRHYTANGTTGIAMIPQYAIPPGEQWSIDFVGVDLQRKAVLYIEVSSSQRPTRGTLEEIARHDEWVPIVRRSLAETSPFIDHTWTDFIVVFVVDRAVEDVRRRLRSPNDIAIEPLSRCYPAWLTGKPYTAAEPRPPHHAAQLALPAAGAKRAAAEPLSR